MSAMTRCPRTGRSPWRRKKNCLLLGIACAILITGIQVTQFNDGFQPLRPLGDAESEARRLLKYITHYHYQCNVTFQVSNRSHWPICVDEAGIELEDHEPKLAYTIGSHSDMLMERALALNHSFNIFIMSDHKVAPALQHINNTHIIESVIVPNDPADFSRNLYGQQTLNDLMNNLHHSHIDLLRLHNTASNVHIWELLHFLVQDGLLSRVDQLHIAMYIDKIDEDLLYNWYRTLYWLFYKAGFRLYHTAASDSLCVQVTMMESCLYHLAFIRNPGPSTFILHPPAHFGTAELEEERLLTYLSRPQVDCKQRIIGGDAENQLHFTTPGQPQWQVCSSGVYQLFNKPCSVYRFRTGNDHVLEQKFIQEGCSVHTFEPVLQHSMGIYRFKIHAHYPFSRPVGHKSRVISTEGVFDRLHHHGPITLLEIDVPGHEWDILAEVLNSGILVNVSQVVAQLQLPDTVHGKHPTILRSRYSQLQRLEASGFTLFHASHSAPWRPIKHKCQPPDEDCCFKVGFVRRDSNYR